MQKSVGTPAYRSDGVLTPADVNRVRGPRRFDTAGLAERRVHLVGQECYGSRGAGYDLGGDTRHPGHELQDHFRRGACD